MLHGHCHQKALVGTTAAERTLALSGAHVDTVDAGCCGMAGAFGYEAEHLDVSHKMAERVLAPAVRAASEDTRIAAPGFSCRSQIKDTTQRTAHHPAQILRDALAR
jgi:Fe-S oxidoreductase